VKTVRFSEVVARSGRPEIHLTWTTPAADRGLQAAVKQTRVSTVHQQVRGAKKENKAPVSGSSITNRRIMDAAQQRKTSRAIEGKPEIHETHEIYFVVVAGAASRGWRR